MRSTIKIAITVLTIATLLVLVAIFTGFVGRPLQYEIAESFQGWATIEYGKPECPGLEGSGLFVNIHVDEYGKGCTSSPLPKGWRYTKFVRVDKSGNQTSLPWSSDDSSMVWAWSNRTPQGGRQFFMDVFFVGTADQLKAAWPKEPT